MGSFVLMPLFLCALTSLFDIICSSALEAKPGENVTICIEDEAVTTGYMFWFKHTVDSAPLLLGCKQVKRSGETQKCYFFNDSERIKMSVHGKKTSLTITAVTVSDTGLYYCSFIKFAEIKFCKSVYLQVKVFGAVRTSLLTILIFIILKHRKKLADQNTDRIHGWQAFESAICYNNIIIIKFILYSTFQQSQACFTCYKS
ncbi:hypothetical protein Q7C36_014102 [Tachysurus vachellii]|uniref:Ig-like domain-containing protein n=1 Tax=Tachysurus vachellii TaxID=175792 RepID=A0AA88SGU2_TACVA|nr:hypothetical protein Q7C36_014102 [Tachysurus vachellii]